MWCPLIRVNCVGLGGVGGWVNVPLPLVPPALMSVPDHQYCRKICLQLPSKKVKTENDVTKISATTVDFYIFWKNVLPHLITSSGFEIKGREVV